MAPLQFIMSLCLVGGFLSAQKLEGNKIEREDRSLLNTFPFTLNAQEEEASYENVEPQRRLVPVDNLSPHDDSQKNNYIDVSYDDVATVHHGNKGKRCIDKVETVEETEYDEVVQCDHSYDRRCHTTYVTNYVSQQEEECEENFRKNCFIDYEKVAFNETVQICRKPLVKNCKNYGPEICRTVSLIMRRLPLMRLFRSAESPLLRTVRIM